MANLESQSKKSMQENYMRIHVNKLFPTTIPFSLQVINLCPTKLVVPTIFKKLEKNIFPRRLLFQ